MTTRPTAPCKGSASPWGLVQTADAIIPGMAVKVSTASHGGIWIAPELEAHIPADCRAIGRQYAPEGWYEEDCDILIPMALIPGLLEKCNGGITRATVNDWARRDRRMAPVAAELDTRAARLSWTTVDA